MNTLIMRYLWLWLCSGLRLGLGLTLSLLVTMITQHILTHHKYVHNALQMDTLSEVPLQVVARNKSAATSVIFPSDPPFCAAALNASG